jgi:hypothetical protein
MQVIEFLDISQYRYPFDPASIIRQVLHLFLKDGQGLGVGLLQVRPDRHAQGRQHPAHEFRLPIPAVGSRSRVGLNPTIPQKAAGRVTDPMVCVPNARAQYPAATAAALPLLDPPGVWPGLWGLRVGPASK